MKYRLLSIKQAKRRRDRFVLEFAPERPSLEVGAEALARAPDIFPDAELDEARLEALRADDELQRCRQRAWVLLAHRPRARAELSRALRQRRFPAPVVERVVAALEEKGYLDDAAYARLMVEQSAGRSGPHLVRNRLAAKGVKGETAERALAPLQDARAQQETARRLLEKWNRRSSPADPAKRRQAAAAFLVRRGFDADLVWELVRGVLGDGQDS